MNKRTRAAAGTTRDAAARRPPGATRTPNDASEAAPASRIRSKKNQGTQIKMTYRKGSLDPLAQAALAKGAKYLITYYQDDIARLTALLEAKDTELGDQLAQVRNWRAIAEAGASNAQAVDKERAADALEKEFWIEELVRYRNWVIELLREKAQQPK